MLNILFYFCFAAMIVGSIPLWMKIFHSRKSGGRHLEPLFAQPLDRAESPLGFVDVIVMFLFWAGGQIAALFAAGRILGIDVEKLADVSGDQISWFAIIAAAGQLLATVLALSCFAIRYRSLLAIGIRLQSIGLDVRLGLIAFLMVIPGVLIFQSLLVMVFQYKHPTLEMLADNANALTLSAAWFSAVIVAPICEEVFFRGVLQNWMQRLSRGRSALADDRVLIGGYATATQAGSSEILDDPYASPKSLGESVSVGAGSIALWPIVVTSVLFGLAHFGQGPAPISLFVFGLALGYIFRCTGSILPCIVLHMMLNAFSLFWFTLSVFVKEEAAAALACPASNELPATIFGNVSRCIELFL